MKKLILFLVLFSLGLGVLWWLEGQNSVPEEAPQPLSIDAFWDQPVEKPLDLPQAKPLEVAKQVEPTEEQNVEGMRTSGKVEARWYNDETKLIKMLLVSESSESSTERDLLKDVQIDLFDAIASESELQKRQLGIIEAKTAEIQRIKFNGPKTKHQKMVQLNQLTARISGQQDLTDLEFDAPSGLVDLRDDFQTLFAMQGQIHVRSKELNASGTDALITILNTKQADWPNGLADNQHAQGKDKLQFIEINKDARLDFLHSPDQELSSSKTDTLVLVTGEGSMSVNRIDRANLRSRSFEVWDKAHMNLKGSQNSDLWSDHLQGRLRDSESGRGVFLESITADGNAIWSYLSHLFRGGHLELSTDSQGELSQAALTGFPSILLNLGSYSTKPENQSIKSSGLIAPSQIYIRSDSIIQMERVKDRLVLTVAGPATAESKSFLLRSAGDLVMSFPYAGQGSALQTGELSFHASAGVVMELLEFGQQPYSKLETAELDLTVQYLDDQSPLDFAINTKGGATLNGLLSDGRDFTLDTPGALVVERLNNQLKVREAIDVTIEIKPKRGASKEDPASDSYLARVEHLVQFNLSRQELEANQGVSVTTKLGHFTADRIRTLANDYVEAWGDEEQQVLLSADFGRADADYINVTQGFFLIRGRVTASLIGLPSHDSNIQKLSLSRLDVHCDELEVQLLETKLQRITKAKASGAVSSELSGSKRSLELHHAQQLNLLKTEWFETPGKTEQAIDSQLHLDAIGGVHAHVGLATSRFELRADRVDLDQQDEEQPNQLADIIASGQVQFDGRWQRSILEDGKLAKAQAALATIESIAFDGKGEKLELFANNSARLSAQGSSRVELHGLLPLKQAQFKLTATSVQFGPTHIDAKQPAIDILPGDYRLVSERLIADASAIELQGRTIVTGHTPKGSEWKLSADKVDLHDPVGLPGQAAGPPGLLTVIEAKGNVHFTLGDSIEAFGDVLTRDALGINISGDPCTIVSRRPNSPSTIVNAKWINFDLDLEVITEMGAGNIRAQQSGNGGPTQSSAQASDWSIDFLSFKTEFDQDSILFFLEEPHFTKQNDGERLTLTASYSVIWVPKDKWKDINALGGSPLPRSGVSKSKPIHGSMDVFFEFIRSQGIADVVDEVYFEGPVQTFHNNNLTSRADAVYLDLNSGRGWLAGVTLKIIGSFLGRKDEAITVKADWLRHSEDGSLAADKATITPCDYDEPHIKVVTGALKLSPTMEEDEFRYEVSIKQNGIEIYDLFTIPLPPLEFSTDEQLKPQFPSFRFGNSTRFGQLLSIKFTQPARRLGRFFHNLFSSDGEDVEKPGLATDSANRKARKKKAYKAKYDIDASYLSSRGALLDLGFSIKDRKNQYALEWINGVILDNGRDRGFLRIAKRDRGRFRFWLRTQGHVDFDKSSLGFSFSDQSDPAVQSEFFESQFTRYEQDETYLQWKRTDNNHWMQASAQVRVDEFRAGIEELPSLTAFQGRAPLLQLGSLDLIHRGEFNAAYLRRLTPSRFDLDNDGINESILTSPFQSNGSYSDGLGAQDVFRADSTQSLETPINLGVGGWRLTPFATFTGSYWDNAVDQSHAARIVGDLGVRLSTVLWKRTSSDTLHEFSPFIEYRNDVVSKFDGTPLELDARERALFGNFIHVGSRSRFGVKGNQSVFDLDVRGTFASERSDGGEDGWLPVEVYSRLGINPEGRRFDVWYDGRFDVEQGEAVYSHFSLGTRVRDDFGVQVGYTYGRDENSVKLFDAASVSGFYRWTDKWEFEALQSFSLLEEKQLGFEMVLRRYGHDLIFELESKLREGEGSAIGFSIRPRLGFKPNRIGYTYW